MKWRQLGLVTRLMYLRRLVPGDRGREALGLSYKTFEAFSSLGEGQW